MADPIAYLHMVFTTCGRSVDVTYILIIKNKSLTLIADFEFLDVTAISSCMACRVSNNGRMILVGIQIKKIQALVWWFRDLQKLGQPIDVDLWTAAAITNAGIARHIVNDKPKADMKAADL